MSDCDEVLMGEYMAREETGCWNNEEPTLEQCNNCDAPACEGRLNMNIEEE